GLGVRPRCRSRRKIMLCLRGAFIASGALLLAMMALADLQAAKPAGGGASPALTIVHSTELNGNITPCGCSKPMLGGLPRRASYLKSLGPAAGLLAIDNGDFTEARCRQDELKADTIVAAFNRMN